MIRSIREENTVNNSFTRSFRLPDNVNDVNISANYKDGVLYIELPKSKKEVKVRKKFQ